MSSKAKRRKIHTFIHTQFHLMLSIHVAYSCMSTHLWLPYQQSHSFLVHACVSNESVFFVCLYFYAPVNECNLSLPTEGICVWRDGQESLVAESQIGSWEGTGTESQSTLIAHLSPPGFTPHQAFTPIYCPWASFTYHLPPSVLCSSPPTISYSFALLYPLL